MILTIAYDVVLGIDTRVFKLVKNETIEVLEEVDKYSRVKVLIQQQEVLINKQMLDRIVNSH